LGECLISSGLRVITQNRTVSRSDAEGIMLFAAFTGLLSVSFISPSFAEGLMPHCLFRLLTGIPCPGCGMTRTFHMIGHGNFTDAFLMNPAGPAAFMLVVMLWVRSLVLIVSGRRIEVNMNGRTAQLLILSSVLMMVSVWIYNIFFNPNI